MAHLDSRSSIDEHDEILLQGDSLPFIAPCRHLRVGDPLRWLQLGWQDFKRAPLISLYYGGFLVVLSYLLAFSTWKLGGVVLIVSLMSGLVFLAPVLAIGLYSISCQLQHGRRPQIGYCLREGRRHIGNEVVYSMVLLVIFLLWARAASMVHIFFPMQADPAWSDLFLFLGIGTAIGAVFSALVFMASAFSLPMMLDRKTDTITAVLTSVHAVLQNKLAMLVWATLIGLALAFCIATAFLGFAVIMPVLGYATWHGYRASIDASAWPEHERRA